jgi:hypothetical protein
MFTKICIFEQKGDVSGVYYVLPLMDSTKDPEHEKKNEKVILDALRHDHEANLIGRVPKNNPSCDPAAIKFYYTGTMYRQKLYSTLPVVLPDRILIDVFTCLGSRFGLEQRNIFVEVYKNKTLNSDYYAHIMYVVSPERIASIISIRQWTVFLEDEHVHGM